ncbi:MAG: Tol-Pal system beta propeller repeat protein TolB [Desulfobacterales bacterium PC51MH44]|nr:MAG: Tol-Pal system beta propeller repeat protein TolB [Desulfobacterales bacterium PC51MH44]
MISCRTKILYLIVIVSFLFGPGLCRADYDYIDITDPFLRKIPLAAPLFKKVSSNDATEQLSNSASDLLAETLEFTGYFKILDRDAFLVDPQTEAAFPSVNFHNWTSIGAELLVTGGVLIEDNIVEMELRLYDTFKERLLIGKRYKGSIKDQRKIIRRFCSEVIYSLTGDRGIFNSEIAFVSTSSGNKEIYICEFDGYNPRQVTHTKSITLSPAWSSDGKWLAYTSYAKGKPDLYIKHLKEKRGSVVAKKGINITPAWVPDQFALAATLSFSGDPEIYLLTGAGKVINRVTNNRGIDVSPAWSPDGKNMAFVSKRSGTPQIYIKNLDSGQVRRLTFQGRYNTQPSWSPRGDKVAYSGMENGRSNIFVIEIDGQGPAQLTHNEGDNESPSWSSDGSLIVFSSTRAGPSRIYVMTAYGTDQRRLLALQGEQSEPKWSPNVENK